MKNTEDTYVVKNTSHAVYEVEPKLNIITNFLYSDKNFTNIGTEMAINNTILLEAFLLGLTIDSNKINSSNLKLLENKLLNFQGLTCRVENKLDKELLKKFNIQVFDKDIEPKQIMTSTGHVYVYTYILIVTDEKLSLHAEGSGHNSTTGILPPMNVIYPNHFNNTPNALYSRATNDKTNIKSRKSGNNHAQ